MIKKALTLLASAILLASVSVFPAFAVSNPVTVQDINMTLTAPESWYVITRDTPEDANIFTELSLSKDVLGGMFTQGNIYYSALEPETFSREISVTMTENETLYDWSGLSDADYKRFSEELKTAASQYGTGSSNIEYGDYKMVERNKVKWMNISSTNTDDTGVTYLSQYITIVNGQHINLTFYNYVGAISAEDTALFDQFFEAAVFTQVLAKPGSGSIIDSVSTWVSQNIYLAVGIAAGAVIIIATVVVWVVVAAKRRKREAYEHLAEPDESSELFIESLPPLDETNTEPGLPDSDEREEEH